LKIDYDSHIALAYEKHVLVNGKWQLSPIPRGISGGAIIRIEGTNVLSERNRMPNPKQLLTAITIEHRKEKGDKPGCLIGTRTNVYLELIKKFMPDLL
jgi:hypothetical protein